MSSKSLSLSWVFGSSKASNYKILMTFLIFSLNFCVLCLFLFFNISKVSIEAKVKQSQSPCIEMSKFLKYSEMNQIRIIQTNKHKLLFLKLYEKYISSLKNTKYDRDFMQIYMTKYLSQATIEYFISCPHIV